MRLTKHTVLFEMEAPSLSSGKRPCGPWPMAMNARRAAGLRTIQETALLDMMYDLPTLRNVQKGVGMRPSSRAVQAIRGKSELKKNHGEPRQRALKGALSRIFRTPLAGRTGS